MAVFISLEIRLSQVLQRLGWKTYDIMVIQSGKKAESKRLWGDRAGKDLYERCKTLLLSLALVS